MEWKMRRGQIKHLLYELALTGRISKELFMEQLHDLNNVEPIIRCIDCKYFGEVDSKEPKYHECKYFSNWNVVHYLLDDDYCSCAERKDEVEE